MDRREVYTDGRKVYMDRRDVYTDGREVYKA